MKAITGQDASLTSRTKRTNKWNVWANEVVLPFANFLSYVHRIDERMAEETVLFVLGAAINLDLMEGENND